MLDVILSSVDAYNVRSYASISGVDEYCVHCRCWWLDVDRDSTDWELIIITVLSIWYSYSLHMYIVCIVILDLFKV